MKFQIGDKVTVLHSNEDGEVVDIINDKMVMVNVRGVLFPAYIDQLDFPYFKMFTEKKKIPIPKQKKYVDDLPKEKGNPKAKTADGIWLSFLPIIGSDEFGDDVVESLKIHLINNSTAGYRFHYQISIPRPYRDFQ